MKQTYRSDGSDRYSFRHHLMDWWAALATTEQEMTDTRAAMFR
jgi:hypothetical protein